MMSVVKLCPHGVFMSLAFEMTTDLELSSAEDVRVATVFSTRFEGAPPIALQCIVEVAAQIMRAPVAIVSIVERGRQSFAASCGLSINQTPREYSFCSFAILAQEPMEILDATKDSRFFDNPLVTGSPNIRYYLGVPIQASNGQPLGTLCVIDTVPRGKVAKEQLEALLKLAFAIEDIIERERVSRVQRKRIDELENSAQPTIPWSHGIEKVIETVRPRSAGRDLLVSVVQAMRDETTRMDANQVDFVRDAVFAAIDAADQGGRMTVSTIETSGFVCTTIRTDSHRGLPVDVISELEGRGRKLDVFFEAAVYSAGLLDIRLFVPADQPLA